MNRPMIYRSLTLDANPLGQFGPYLLTLAVCTVFALQPNLYPARVLPIEIPPPSGDAAAPAESVAPAETLPPASIMIEAPAAALPQESVPDLLAEPAPSASVAPIAVGPVLGAAGAAGAAGPIAGGGAQALPATTRAVAALTRRLAATHMPSTLPQPARGRAQATRPAARALPPVHAPTSAAKAAAGSHGALPPSGGALSGLASGNRAPKLGVLGGPGPFTSRVAARIDGTAPRQRF